MKFSQKNIFSFKHFDPVVLYFAIPFLFLVSLLFAMGGFSPTHDEFSFLSESFLKGNLHLVTDNPSSDVVTYQDKQYWPLGPFPAILIAPITFFTNGHVQQNLVEFFTIIATVLLIFYFLKTRFKFSNNNAIWLTMSFIFASVYALIPFWYGSFTLAHAISVFLLFLALFEYYGKKRYWLIGIIFAAMSMTRFTATFAGLFFLFELLSENKTFKEKTTNMIMLGTPVLAGAAFLGWYNMARFDSPFETGYGLLTVLPHLSYLYEYGLFDVRYIPSNIYYYFLDGFRHFANPRFLEGTANMLLEPPYFGGTRWGSTSIFLTAPFMLYAFKMKNDPRFWKVMAVSGILLIIFLSYYYNGWPQVGPRYTLDFMPLLFLLVVFHFKNNPLTHKHKLFILLSAVLNSYLAITMFFL